MTVKQIVSILTGAFAGQVVFAAILLALAPKPLDDGPGLTIAMMLIFGIVPLLLATSIARVVFVAGGPKPWWVAALACAILTGAVFGAFVLQVGYGQVLGLPVLSAGFAGGLIAGGLSAVLAGGLKRPG